MLGSYFWLNLIAKAALRFFFCVNIIAEVALCFYFCISLIAEVALCFNAKNNGSLYFTGNSGYRSSKIVVCGTGNIP